ncbi:MAG TPA: hypothetical protein VMZ28_30380 [Kofleriaceae bacterium]|nr:hypothetical protein [Kofleriaceae bacterium]
MLCPLSRMQMSSALDHGGALPWPARRHAEACDACRAFQARIGALHGRLVAGAGRAPSPPSRPVRSRLPVVAGLVAATAALVLFVALRRGDQPAPAPQVTPPPARVATVTPPPPPTMGITRDTPAQALVDQASDYLDAPPLRHELTALLDDGRRGALAVLDQAGLRQK